MSVSVDVINNINNNDIFYVLSGNQVTEIDPGQQVRITMQAGDILMITPAQYQGIPFGEDDFYGVTESTSASSVIDVTPRWSTPDYTNVSTFLLYKINRPTNSYQRTIKVYLYT